MNVEKLSALEKSLIDIIVDFNGNVNELEYFKQNTNIIGLNLSYLYRTAVFHKMYTLSDTILSSKIYNFNNDDEMKSEIITWAEYDREDCIEKIIQDGYIFDVSNILEILNVLKYNITETNKKNLLTLFTYYLRVFKIKKILQRMHNNQKRHLTN
ncbi:MAG: hypothetical protein WCJ61_11345 [Paludibacter sp.]